MEFIPIDGMKKANQCTLYGCGCKDVSDELHQQLAAGNALNGNRNGDNVNVNPNNADNHNENRGFRCSIRV